MDNSCLKEECGFYDKDTGECGWDGDDNGSKTIAVDIDGTIVDYEEWNGEHHFGEIKDGAIEQMKRLENYGFSIILHTCRKSKERIKKFADENNIPYSWINFNPHQCPAIDKVLADFYMDDRGVHFDGDWKEAVDKVIERSEQK